MERRALVAEAVLACAELTEVLSGLGNNIVVELEDDAPCGLVVDGDVELECTKIVYRSVHLVPPSSEPVEHVAKIVSQRGPEEAKAKVTALTKTLDIMFSGWRDIQDEKSWMVEGTGEIGLRSTL